MNSTVLDGDYILATKTPVSSANMGFCIFSITKTYYVPAPAVTALGNASWIVMVSPEREQVMVGMD